jgi:hypothetical protein
MRRFPADLSVHVGSGHLGENTWTGELWLDVAGLSAADEHAGR